MKKLMMSALLALPLTASAVDINLNVTCGNVGGTENSGLCGQLTDEVREEIDNNTPDVSLDKYAAGISNATAFAYKGSGSDYSDMFTYASIKASLGTAVAGDLSDPENAEGFGLGAAVTVGINLDLLPIDKIGFIEFEKMDLFVSFMSYSVDQDLGDDGTAEGDLSSFGIFARYQILEGKDIVGGYMLEWGGVHLHTGIQRSSMGLEYTTSLADEQVDIGGGQTATFGNSSIKFDLDSTVTSIPVEVSTYLRAAYVFTFYTGLGFDINSGSTDIDLKSTGTVSGDGASTYSATLSADENSSGDADTTNFRGFLGVQFNVPFVRIYAQANKALGSDLLGVNLGAKVLF